MGQYNLRFEQEEFTELVRLYSELAKIADRQMNEYQSILGESFREMSKKLNEFVRDVDEADGDIYGIGTYEAY